MSNNNFTTPLSSGNKPENAPQTPAQPGNPTRNIKPSSPNGKDEEKSNTGVVIGVAAGASVAAGVAAAYAADKIMSDPEEPLAEGSEAVGDAASGLFAVNNTEVKIEEHTHKTPAENEGEVNEDEISDFQMAALDHADSEYDLWAGTEPASETPENDNLAESDILPDVDPDLLTADLTEDVYLVDPDDVETPGFYNPTSMEVVNIDGHMETWVGAELPAGEQVYLIDSDGDGSFDQVYSLDGQPLNTDQLAFTTVDDAKAILMDNGVEIPGDESNLTASVSMGDINETADDFNDSIGGETFDQDFTADATPDLGGADDFGGADSFSDDL